MVNTSPTTNQALGFWSAVGVPSLGVLYIAIGAVGLMRRPADSMDRLLPIEPYVSICRLIMLVLIADLVVLFAALHVLAPRDRKAHSLAAFGFACTFAAIAGTNTFLLLTVAPQAANTAGLNLLFSFRWPSVNLALDLFAWGPVLGLAMLSAASVVRGSKLRAVVRAGLSLGGALCLGNVLCFVFSDVRFSLLGIIGYDLILPVTCIPLAMLFRGTSNLSLPQGKRPEVE